jgi:hypothetical protein
LRPGPTTLFVVGDEVRETAQAFVGLVTIEGLVLPPLQRVFCRARPAPPPATGAARTAAQ